LGGVLLLTPKLPTGFMSFQLIIFEQFSSPLQKEEEERFHRTAAINTNIPRKQTLSVIGQTSDTEENVFLWFFLYSVADSLVNFDDI
jgi:hypothetical protein